MAKDINSGAFSEETKLKLSIFRDCYKEWLPVFLNNSYIDKIFIFDLFAGSGKDVEGTSGSPLILLQETKGDNCKYCKQLSKNNRPEIWFGFNEREKNKFISLKENVKYEFINCEKKCPLGVCILSGNYIIDNKDFQELINS